MFHNSRRIQDAGVDSDHTHKGIPITRTDGGSVSAIRHFMFGDKSTDGRRFNSLYHWKKCHPEMEPQVKLKSPSFRSTKRNFFQSWSKSISRYASTPDLNNVRPDVMRSDKGQINKSYKGNEEFSVMPSVRKMVKELEKSASMVSRLPLSKPNKRTIGLYDPDFSEVSLKPDSISNQILPSPSISCRQNNSCMKKAVSLKDVQESSYGSGFGVSNPLYAEVHRVLRVDDHSIEEPLYNDKLYNLEILPSSQIINHRKYSTEFNLNNQMSDIFSDSFQLLKKSDHCTYGNSEVSNSLSDISKEHQYTKNLTLPHSGVGRLNDLQDKQISCEDKNLMELECSQHMNSVHNIENDINENQSIKNEIIEPTSGKTVVVQEPGRFLARWIPVEDLSSRDYESATEASGETNASPDVNIDASICSEVFLEPKETPARGQKMKRPAERRESGRFPSASRILRSLTRNRGEEDRKDVSSASLARSNPHYHSEGKGNKKKKMEREAGASQKERSRSFCDKPEMKKKFVQQQENKILRQEAKAKLDQAEYKNLDSFAVRKLTESPSLNAFHDRSSSLPSSPNSPPVRNEVSPGVYNIPSSFLTENHSEERENDYKSALECDNVFVLNEKENDPNQLERDKDRRSSRKLTKDSGYETSPYSEGDYANLDLFPSEGETSIKANIEEGINDLRNEVESLSSRLKEEGHTSERLKEEAKCISSVSASSGNSRGDPSDSDCPEAPQTTSPFTEDSKSLSPADSLTNFADSLIVNVPSASPGGSLVPAKSTPSLYHNANCVPTSYNAVEEEASNVNGVLHASKSTPNLEGIVDEDETMVTNKSSYFLQGSTSPSVVMGTNRGADKRYWNQACSSEDAFNPTDYAHHLRSSSYQILHSRQLSAGSCHSRQHSNTSNYSGDDVGYREDVGFTNTHQQSSSNLADRSRCFSFDNLGFDNVNHSNSIPWNISEPDLSLTTSVTSSSCSLSQKYEKGQISPSAPSVPLVSKKSSPNNSKKLSPSPPPPPVRDASSLKYIRYGPGHEKFPSWPVPAGSSLATQNHDGSISGISDSSSNSYISPQGSHRSHSWTEQSEYPKEKCAGYARPFLKRQFSPSFQKQLLTVMEKCEKISPEVFNSRPPDDILKGPSYSLIDSYLHQSTYYPPYDREGRGIDDKDYSIPSPPERDPGMGEPHLSQMTAAQLEEHTRRCDFGYSDFPYPDFPQITPLLDQLRQESYTWDGASERDSGRGESESVTDSRYSNGRESVTTVVTNSSSASSSETLKWHGSLSDVSVLSGQSRDTKGDHNIVHSARVQAPQRQNSESVQYYSTNGRGKHKYYEPRTGREGNYPRPYRDGKWSRDVERSNEANNLKKFPSYSYTQPLSQISEAPLAESREASLPTSVRSPKNSTIDFSKPPSVAERINELERQSVSTTTAANSFIWPRDHSEPRDSNHYRDEQGNHYRDEQTNHYRDEQINHYRDEQTNHYRDEQYCSLGNSHEESLIECDIKQTSSERDSRLDSMPTRSDSINEYPSINTFQSPSSPSISNNHHPSSMRRDSDDSVLSSDSSHHSFGEPDRSISSTSYTYLDPEKRCKVSDATLKNIQKQALLSFYERRTGKSFNAGSPSSSVSSMACSIPSSEVISPDWAGKNLRRERGTRPCRGMAKLARVPNSEFGLERNGEIDRHGAKPTRRRSMNGRVREDSLTDTSSGLDVQMHLTKSPKMNFSSLNSCHNESDQENGPEGERRPSLSTRICHDISAPTSSTPEVKEEKFISSTEEDLPPLPPSLEDTPPKPPDRPPKKVNLRSLFHPPSEEPLAENVSNNARPYFYRKPPAPDPPQTPPESPPPLSINSDTSRSSTPDLPPPPPPPPPPPVTEDAVVFDEPLPPPPQTETPHDSTTSSFSLFNEIEIETPVLHTPPKPVYKETYHKDSYMAHRKDWKTGYEGRYRRTHSPSAPDRNGIHTATSRDNLMNMSNNLKNSQSKPVSHPITSYNAGNMRSALSTSSLVQRPSSPVDNVSFLSEKTNLNNNANKRINKGWNPHVRQKSTTVNFTAEELRAFKARRAAQEGLLSSTGDLNSASSSPSPLRPLTRAFSMGEPFHIQNGEENGDATSEETNLNSLGSIPLGTTHSHDGPITAHPAQVTEEVTSFSTKRNAPSPPTASLSEDFSLSDVLKTSQPSTSPPTSPIALSVTSSTSSLASASSSSSSSTLVSSNSTSTASSTTIPTSVTQPSFNKVDYRRTLSSIGTCPSMSLPNLAPDEFEGTERANIFVLKYGRVPKVEEVDCDKLSFEFAQIGNMNPRLHSLLVGRSPYKSMASYMDGIFALEMRKDLLCRTHASHPDFNVDRSAEAGNSLCFSSSESKLWATTRETPVENDLDASQIDNQYFNKKKEALTISITRKLDILREVQNVIREEMSQNLELGLLVTKEVDLRANPSEAGKVKLHVEEIDKITSLLLGLSGRLARVENSLILIKDEENVEQKRILEGKRDKLTDQLEEAKKLKENIDKRAVQVCKILMKYLTEEEFAEYDHFVKMKAKLIMDARETDDKIRIGEEQLQALKTLLPLI